MDVEARYWRVDELIEVELVAFLAEVFLILVSWFEEADYDHSQLFLQYMNALATSISNQFETCHGIEIRWSSKLDIFHQSDLLPCLYSHRQRVYRIPFKEYVPVPRSVIFQSLLSDEGARLKLISVLLTVWGRNTLLFLASIYRLFSNWYTSKPWRGSVRL